MEKFEGNLKYIYKTGYYTNYSYKGEEVFVYKFKDENDNIYVWKTGLALLMTEDKTEINIDSIIRVKASIKGENDYKGEHQILLTRVKILEIIEQGLSEEEKREIKRQNQLDSLTDGDFVWFMPYRQYKTHYADCETLAGSFKTIDGTACVSVIIREGRLKNSGVRGEHYYGFKLENSAGQWIVLRAVKEENALKRAQKLHPDETWHCVKVYDYRSYDWM